MQMLTSAVASEGYAQVKEGFEREANERARAFEKLTNAQDRTNQSVDQLKSEIESVSGAVAAMEATLDQRFDELYAEVGASMRTNCVPKSNHNCAVLTLTNVCHCQSCGHAGASQHSEDHGSDAGVRGSAHRPYERDDG